MSGESSAQNFTHLMASHPHGDHARSFAVGNIDKSSSQLMKVTKESLYKGIEQAKSGNRIGDIGFAIQSHVQKYGYGIVRDLVGHGIGSKLHEDHFK